MIMGVIPMCVRASSRFFLFLIYHRRVGVAALIVVLQVRTFTTCTRQADDLTMGNRSGQRFKVLGPLYTTHSRGPVYHSSSVLPPVMAVLSALTFMYQLLSIPYATFFGYLLGSILVWSFAIECGERVD